MPEDGNNEEERRVINMFHLDMIARSVYMNGEMYASGECRGYDVCAVKAKEGKRRGAVAFAVPSGESPKPEDITCLKPSKIEKIIRQTEIYVERFYVKEKQ